MQAKPQFNNVSYLGFSADIGVCCYCGDLHTVGRAFYSAFAVIIMLSLFICVVYKHSTDFESLIHQRVSYLLFLMARPALTKASIQNT